MFLALYDHRFCWRKSSSSGQGSASIGPITGLSVGCVTVPPWRRQQLWVLILEPQAGALEAFSVYTRVYACVSAAQITGQKVLGQ